MSNPEEDEMVFRDRREKLSTNTQTHAHQTYGKTWKFNIVYKCTILLQNVLPVHTDSSLPIKLLCLATYAQPIGIKI